MHTHAHIAQTFLLPVLILRKKCVYLSLCCSPTALNSLSTVNRACWVGETQGACIYFKVVLCLLCNFKTGRKV